MVTIPIEITDAQDAMLEWSAIQRKTTKAILVAEAAGEFLRSLEARYLEAHKHELADLFQRLPTSEQLTYLEQLRTAVENQAP